MPKTHKYEKLTATDFLKKVNLEKEASAFETAEKIPFKTEYFQEDTRSLKHCQFVSGLPPFLGGPYRSMYTSRPWTVRQYAGFSTAEDSNAFYRRNLNASI